MPANSFVWYELMTTDPAAAARFYADVVGWTQEDSPNVGHSYFVMSGPSGRAAGVMDLPERFREQGGRPGWIGYVGVASVDEAARAFNEAGGTVHREPADIPGVGRFAIVADPQGAVLALFSPGGPGAATASGPGPGQGGWHELYASDWEAAFAFYAARFGWTKAEALDMGPMGAYQLFAADGVQIGGMMNRPEQVPRPVWQYYFNVPSIGAAIEKLRHGGGQVLMGPHQVPGGSWIVHGVDPQGAHFALVAGAE